MIEPFYFQCFLRWLNDDVLDTGLVASVLNTGLICNSSDDDGEYDKEDDKPKEGDYQPPVPAINLGALMKKKDDKPKAPTIDLLNLQPQKDGD